MDTACSHPTADEFAQSCIYSFRCSQAMDASLSRIMKEQGLNRSSVIRLALYTLHCYLYRKDVQGLSLEQLLGRIESLSPEPGQSFARFLSGH